MNVTTGVKSGTKYLGHIVLLAGVTTYSEAEGCMGVATNET
jgi:hypothetical protein